MQVGAKRFMLRLFGVIVAILLIGLVVLAFVFRQDILDHIAARQFEPSPEVAELVEQLPLTEAGERVFLASQPSLEASQLFNEQCAAVDHSEQGHVLGCYTAGQIYLYQVTDERLEGIVEVTAAHELLHAAFSRLGAAEKTELVNELIALYDELSATDPDLAKRMSVYENLSRLGFANELHSVLGTEVRELPDWLEQHYARWFEDRGTIVDFFDGYHQVFDELQEEADELQARMTKLRESISTRSSSYDKAVEKFNADWTEFNRRNRAFEFSDNVAEFNRLRDDLYDRRDALNERRESINDDVDEYEKLRQRLLELSDLNNDLEETMNSNLAPPKAVADAGE